MDNARRVVQLLADENDQIVYLFTGTGTGPDESADGSIITMNGPGTTHREIRDFIQHWKPDGLIWMGGDLDPLILSATDHADIPRFLIAADTNGLIPPNRRWLPGMRRALLSRFDRILATSQQAASRLQRWAGSKDKIEVAGAFEEDVPLLPFNEAEYSDVVATTNLRPVWLVVNAIVSELPTIIAAHQNACRRSHRLLLVVSPRDMNQATDIANILCKSEIATVLRSETDPDESTRALVADLPGELGLWYRLAPLTYVGGTLTRGGRHPYEGAALGTAIIHGPRTSPYEEAYKRLDAAKGAYPIAKGDDLAHAVETLLSPDKVATIAHSAWEVTSQGAEVSNRVSELILEITTEDAN